MKHDDIKLKWKEPGLVFHSIYLYKNVLKETLVLTSLSLKMV